MGTETFLKLSGIPGYSLAEGHKGEIQLQSWSWGPHHVRAAKPGEDDRFDPSRDTLSSINCTKTMDSTSPSLALAATKGTPIHEATLTVRQTGEVEDFLVLKLKEVTITALQFSGGGGGDRPASESFTMDFEKLLSKYADTANGPTHDVRQKMGWDVTQSRL